MQPVYLLVANVELKILRILCHQHDTWCSLIQRAPILIIARKHSKSLCISPWRWSRHSKRPRLGGEREREKQSIRTLAACGMCKIEANNVPCLGNNSTELARDQWLQPRSPSGCMY